MKFEATGGDDVSDSPWEVLDMSSSSSESEDERSQPMSLVLV